jgi:hypothetical protein
MIAHITIMEIYLTLPILVAILAGYWFVISWKEYEKQNNDKNYIWKRESKEEGSSRKEQTLMES